MVLLVKMYRSADTSVYVLVFLQKPPVAGGKPVAGGGASAAAKSRLAAVKAAMKAKHADRKAPETSDNNQDASSSAPASSANPLPVQTVVFHGGFFQVESPVKPSGKNVVYYGVPG